MDEQGRKDLLEEIRSTGETHPLHRFFEWDDAVAAEQYRFTQANQLIEDDAAEQYRLIQANQVIDGVWHEVRPAWRIEAGPLPEKGTPDVDA